MRGFQRSTKAYRIRKAQEYGALRQKNSDEVEEAGCGNWGQGLG